ncbi:MAG: DUF362 domain-containing protein [Candidatus Sabulitectum sp.]|nr:DUF362 domain-containing protein [Candidatus Sabulitectum sp.]
MNYDVVIQDGFGFYCTEKLKESIASMVEDTGGWPRGTSTGNRVLLKVNMLAAKHPARGITTHPAVVAAVSSLLRDRGCEVFIGDSPGGAVKGVERYWRNCGFNTAAEITGARLVSFEGSGSRRITVHDREYDIALPILEGYDCKINMCKFKTHMYTRMTNAVKNSFGIVPGLGKAMLHMRSPRPRDLAVNIVDLYEIADFSLHISDGILCMDGRGPSTDGRRRHEGFLALSRNGVCLDMVLSQMAGLPWDQLDSNVEAFSRGLAKPFSEITVQGSHEFVDFDIPDRSYLNYIPRWLGSVARLLMRTAPVSNDSCTGCGVCKRACPVDAIEIRSGRAKMKKGTCIMCLCCHELCPENAVELKLPFGRS